MPFNKCTADYKWFESTHQSLVDRHSHDEVVCNQDITPRGLWWWLTNKMHCFKNVIITVVERTARSKIVFNALTLMKAHFYFSQMAKWTTIVTIKTTICTLMIIITVKPMKIVGSGELQRITCQRWFSFLTLTMHKCSQASHTEHVYNRSFMNFGRINFSLTPTNAVEHNK